MRVVSWSASVRPGKGYEASRAKLYISLAIYCPACQTGQVVESPYGSEITARSLNDPTRSIEWLLKQSCGDHHCSHCRIVSDVHPDRIKQLQRVMVSWITPDWLHNAIEQLGGETITRRAKTPQDTVEEYSAYRLVANGGGQQVKLGPKPLPHA